MLSLNPIAKIHLNRLTHNFDYIQSHIGTSNILAVVKANAYGHGAVEISKQLQKLDVAGLCVATASELLEIRNAKIKAPILHLGVLNSKILDLYQSDDNICTINSIDDITMIDSLLTKNRKKINCYLKVDTGMGRLGVPYENFNHIINLMKNMNKINLVGIYSHFSSSDEEGRESIQLQLNRFDEIINSTNSLVSEEQHYHISNSAGLLKNNSVFYDYVRAGISLYGINNTDAQHNLRPVMELKAPIVFTKKIKEGDSVGYNKKFIASKETMVGYLQIGYADGYPLEMMNSKHVFYKGELLKVIGKVSMDLTAVDFTDINFNIGDYVTLFGHETNRLENLCLQTGTNPYSILTNIGNRVNREYLND